MRYATYYVAKGNSKEIIEKIKRGSNKHIIINKNDDFTSFVVLKEKMDFWKSWGWLLEFFDSKDCGWGFSFYSSGQEAFKAIYEKNNEAWFFKSSDNGYIGDMQETASLLGVNPEQFKSCLIDDGINKLHQLIGVQYPNELIFQI